MTTFDFGFGPVPAHRHPNGGGWVADTAQVFDNTLVFGNTQVFDNARVFGNAQVSGNARVFDKARVYGDAQVSGDARVAGKARIYGIMRSDDYCFVAVPCADGKKRIIAGCRYFTLAEAKKHWNKKHRDYKEVSAILQFFITTGQL